MAYLEGRITALEQEVEASCGEGALRPVATAVQQEAYFVGRVCCDAGKVDAASWHASSCLCRLHLNSPTLRL